MSLENVLRIPDESEQTDTLQQQTTTRVFFFFIMYIRESLNKSYFVLLVLRCVIFLAIYKKAKNITGTINHN